MSEHDTQPAMVTIGWNETLDVVMYFLYETSSLPGTVTDKQLVDLMTACGNARQRLRETSGG